jgi:hypothetical protein
VRPAAAGLKPIAPASLFLVVDVVPPDVTAVPEFPGLPWLPAHWNLPLMTSLGPFSLEKTAQELSMLPEDWMLKAPRLSLRAASSTL